MPRLSTLSNPTGLLDIDKGRVGIIIDDAGKTLAFSLVRLDLANIELPPSLNVVVIARRGNAEERVELGSLSAWDKGYRPLTEIGDDGTWTFRILLVQPGSAKLIAAAENVRPDGLGDSDSFIALEAADLGERPWEIEIHEQDGQAVIRFNKEIYQSAGAAEADHFFTALVLPEAIRRISEWIAARPDALDEPAWEPFKAWLLLHGITEAPDADPQQNWCADVVGAFCNRFEFATHLKALRAKGFEE